MQRVNAMVTAVAPTLFGTRDQFGADSITLYLLYALFLLLSHQLHLRSSGIRCQRLGTVGQQDWLNFFYKGPDNSLGFAAKDHGPCHHSLQFSSVQFSHSVMSDSATP